MSEEPDTVAMTGRVEWTAAGRKAMREKSGLFPDMFSEQEVAENFGVSLRWVRDHARANGVGRKIGRAWWFTKAEGPTLSEVIISFTSHTPYDVRYARTGR